jgi:hypothetical protein
MFNRQTMSGPAHSDSVYAMFWWRSVDLFWRTRQRTRLVAGSLPLLSSSNLRGPALIVTAVVASHRQVSTCDPVDGPKLDQSSLVNCRWGSHIEMAECWKIACHCPEKWLNHMGFEWL